MSIRKERYWLRNRELVHGVKMYVMPQLGVRISWRERCKPGPRHHPSSRVFYYSEPIPSPRGNVAARHRFERDFLHVFGDSLASDPRLAFP